MRPRVLVGAGQQDGDIGLRLGRVVEHHWALRGDEGPAATSVMSIRTTRVTQLACRLLMGDISMTSPSRSSKRASSPNRPVSPMRCHSSTVNACRTTMAISLGEGVTRCSGHEAWAWYSSMAAEGMWAMPLSIT